MGGRSFIRDRHGAETCWTRGLADFTEDKGKWSNWEEISHEGIEYAAIDLEDGVRCELRFHGQVLAAANGNNFKRAKKAAASVLVGCDHDPALTVLPLLHRHCQCQ